MQEFRKTVFLMIPAFLFISLFSSSCFAPGKTGYSHGHRHDYNLPPGLAKKGKAPHGWAKKCGHRKVKHGRFPRHNRACDHIS